jgi:hypothetical protein
MQAEMTKAFVYAYIFSINLLISGCYEAPDSLSNSIAAGCYTGTGLPLLLIKGDMMIFDQPDLGPIEFTIKVGKQWDYIQTKPISLDYVGGVLKFQVDEGIGIFWPISLNDRNLVDHIEPFSKYEGEEGYRRTIEQECSGIRFPGDGL